MCLGIPMKLVSIDGRTGKAEQGGVRRAVALDLVPEAREGDYVIVHAGYGIQILDEAAAQETLALLSQIEEAMR
jgi:hydrogenase expression/formation protein HypC